MRVNIAALSHRMHFVINITRHFIQDHVEHLRREPLEEVAVGAALAPGHDGPRRKRPNVSPLETLGLGCECALLGTSGGSPCHCDDLLI